jgi:CRISPR/Cas system-associated endonuclease/helicase Cas3
VDIDFCSVIRYFAGLDSNTHAAGRCNRNGRQKLMRRFRTLKAIQNEFKTMAEMKAIHEVQEGVNVFYLDQLFYGDKFGWSEEIVNDMDFFSV